jgi:hypothetical protein
LRDQRTGDDADRLRRAPRRPRRRRIRGADVELDPAAPTLSIPRRSSSSNGQQRFVFFTNAESDRGNVLYHRYDGHYGLITSSEIGADRDGRVAPATASPRTTVVPWRKPHSSTSARTSRAPDCGPHASRRASSSTCPRCTCADGKDVWLLDGTPFTQSG